MPRLFVAIELPDEAKDRLQALCLGGLPGARWVTERQFHLTLHFAGEVDGPLARRLEEALHGVRADPFELQLAGLGHFPPRGEPRVLWAGVAPSEELATLHSRLQSCLRRNGFPLETRRFSPHVTLARLQGTSLDDVRRFLDEHEPFAGEPCAVTDFQLYSSVLGKGGAQHSVEASYPLFGRGPG